MKEPAKIRAPKRAITLGGGGPAAGLHIGVLEALRNAGITFDVWALSCIGAWVGILYNQYEEDKVEQTYQFFKDGVFRDDESYERFPINTVFGPDWRSTATALKKFVTDSNNYKEFGWDPYRMIDSFQESVSLLFNLLPDRDNKKKFEKLDDGDINRWILNHAMAPNPLVRYLTSMMYLSNVNGLSRINYPDSEFMKGINFDRLFEKKNGNEGKTEEERKKKWPFIFHNAWNLDEQKLALFSNKAMKSGLYKGPISASTLCACSALPFIEETVKIGGVTYCEGALVDTVNFKSLIEEHPDLDEIWVSRIVDAKQIRKPENLHDALANLCQLFAATVGEDDVRLFKYHVKYDDPKPGKKAWKGTVVEIHVPAHISFKWNHSNLDQGRKRGKAAAEKAIEAYFAAGEHKVGVLRFINEKPEKEDKKLEFMDLDAGSIDKSILAKAIAQTKGKDDPGPWLKKMDWQVASNTGKQVQPNLEGEYPRGSIPYPAFAIRNAKVRAAYLELANPGPDLNAL